MYPRLFTPPVFELFGRDIQLPTLHTYGVILAIAFLVGLFGAKRAAQKAGLDAARVTDLCVYVLIAGLIGAKLLLIITEWRSYYRNPRELWSVFQSAGVFYGGLIAAFPVAWWYVRRHQLPGWQTADVLAPFVVLGQAIGRIGCLAAGCCHGRSTNVAWAITFRDAYAMRQIGTPVDIPMHPTQIYESIAAFLIFIVLWVLAPRKRFHGQVVLTYIVLYSAVRFGLEFFRGDAGRGMLFDLLTTSQFIGILMTVGALILFPYLARRQRVAAVAATT